MSSLRDFSSCATEYMRSGVVKFGSIAAAIFSGLYMELFYEFCGASLLGSPEGFTTSGPTPLSISRAVFFSLIFYCLFCLISIVPPSKKAFLFRYRYLIGIVVVLGLLIFEISYSSIGMWSSTLPGGDKSGLLFGVPRAIRSDEYNVTTLWNFSQEHNGYLPWTEILRGDATDTRLVYNLASWSIATLFRPQLWGYLLLGSARGLSWFWSFKLFGVFFSSFECMRVLSRDDRTLSFVFAIMISFSPMMLWWGFWEGIIFGQYLVVALSKYLAAPSFFQKSVISSLLGWLCGCYVLTLYPAWMVPFFYVYASMGIIVIGRYAKQNRRRTLISPRDIIPLLVALCISGIALAWVFFSSRDALLSTASTVYPGKRFETGGGQLLALFNYSSSLFFPIQQPSVSNASELASMSSFFPLGSILALLCLNKRKYFTLIILMAVQAVLVVYISIGFPSFFSKITLFSNVPASRALFAAGYLEITLLVLSVSIMIRQMRVSRMSADDTTFRFTRAKSFFFFCCMVAALLISRAAIPGYSRLLFTSLEVMMFVCFGIALFSAATGKAPEVTKRLIVTSAIACILLPGLCVHPVQKGIAPVNNSEFAQAVSSIVSKDQEAKWVVEGPWQYSNLCSALGASTYFSTNAYPDMKIWREIDPSGQFEDVYNRYAHVGVEISLDHSSTIFLTSPDAVSLSLSINDLSHLGVSYLVSSKEYPYELDGVGFELLDSGNGQFIYRLKY